MSSIDSLMSDSTFADRQQPRITNEFEPFLTFVGFFRDDANARGLFGVRTRPTACAILARKINFAITR
jgi:hypothetical protein